MTELTQQQKTILNVVFGFLVALRTPITRQAAVDALLREMEDAFDIDAHPGFGNPPPWRE